MSTAHKKRTEDVLNPEPAVTAAASGPTCRGCTPVFHKDAHAGAQTSANYLLLPFTSTLRLTKWRWAVRSYEDAAVFTSTLPQHLLSRCDATEHLSQGRSSISQPALLLSLSLSLTHTLSLYFFPSTQEACALLLEESLHYLQDKFLCGAAADQAARAYHGNLLPFDFYPSSSSPSSTFGPTAAASFAVHRLGLVIDGRTLAYALDKSLEDKFLAVARSCRSVLCCRSTPLQKSMVVKLVRNKLKVMTLAIGRPLLSYKPPEVL